MAKRIMMGLGCRKVRKYGQPLGERKPYDRDGVRSRECHGTDAHKATNV